MRPTNADIVRKKKAPEGILVEAPGGTKRACISAMSLSATSSVAIETDLIAARTSLRELETMAGRTGSTRGVIVAGTYRRADSAFDRLLPRPLLPVAHKPLISYGLSWLRHAGITDVAVCGNREKTTSSPIGPTGSS